MVAVLEDLELDRLGPARLWTRLPADVREAAARAMFASDDDEVRMEAALALAQQLRFRPRFVQKLPVAKRVAYLARQVRPDDNLAGSLLLALHLGERRPLLVTFLDALGIPHDDGIIDEDHDLDAPTAEALTGAVERLDAAFDRDPVDVYLATLFALDAETWGGLEGILRDRSAA